MTGLRLYRESPRAELDCLWLNSNQSPSKCSYNLLQSPNNEVVYSTCAVMSWWDHLHWTTALDWAAGNDSWNSSKAFLIAAKVSPAWNKWPQHVSNLHWRNVRLSRHLHTQDWVPQCYHFSSGPWQSPWCKPQNSLRSCQWICYLDAESLWHSWKVQRVWTSSQTLSGLQAIKFILPVTAFQCLEVLTQKIKNVEVLRLYRTANKISPREGLLDE